MTRLSIIVPIYNQAPYLRPCLDSIWFQDYPGTIEIIVVNDGSTDNTADEIASFESDLDKAKTSYASKYNSLTDTIERVYHNRYPEKGRSLRVIHHKLNKGLASALNTGFQACTGDYCTYVPSDNRCTPNMFTELATALDAGYDFVYSDMLIVDSDSAVIRFFSLPDYSFKRCFADWYMCGVSKLYRRNLHERFGWYDEKLLAHDHELFQRFAEGGATFIHVPKALMYVFFHDNEREINIHSPSNWHRLLEESKQLTLRACKFLANPTGQGDTD